MGENLLLVSGEMTDLVVIGSLGVLVLVLLVVLLRTRVRKNRVLYDHQMRLSEQHEQIARQSRQLDEQAEKLAALSAMHTRFWATTSHELRTPLTVILGVLTEKLRTMTDDSDAVFRWDEVAIMHRNAQRLLQVTNQLLGMTGSESKPLGPTVLTPARKALPRDGVWGGNGPDNRPTVLLVEDNDDLRMFIRSHLQRIYRVLESTNGMQGLQTALEKAPDLIISDRMMPEMDGDELCRRIKSDERIRHIPVMILSALATPEQKEASLKSGADDYLAKPFDSRELLARIQTLLETRRNADGASAPVFRVGTDPAVPFSE
ncbi:response regulator [Larkinella bovis]|uniref:histidine kinase n=1 Tax=Larkinella bovis TaxID=683041 RepID=A0ABW0I571_9BACT